jgi:hypothetical protein
MNRGVCFPILAFLVLGASRAAADTAFHACGTQVQGVECVLFEAGDGKRYVLSDRGSFEVGDRVCVRGTLEPECVSICQQGDGCIAVASIRACLLPLPSLCGMGLPTCLPAVLAAFAFARTRPAEMRLLRRVTTRHSER